MAKALPEYHVVEVGDVLAFVSTPASWTTYYRMGPDLQEYGVSLRTLKPEDVTAEGIVAVAAKHLDKYEQDRYGAVLVGSARDRRYADDG